MGYIEGSSKLPVEKVLAMSLDSPLPNATFQFQITGVNVAANQTVENLPLIKGYDLDDPATEADESIISIKMDATDSTFENHNSEEIAGLKGKVTGVSQKAEFDMSKAGFDQAGVYRYMVQEVNTTLSYVTYDTAKFFVDVYVGANGTDDDGNTVYSVKYIKGYKATASGTGVDTTYTVGDKSPIIFKNTMNTTTIEIKKDAYDYMDEDNEFDFWIKIPKGGDTMVLKQGETFKSEIITNNSTAPAEDQGELIQVGGDDKKLNDDNETYTYLDASVETPSAARGWCHFKLKAGQSLKIYNVPVNMIYFLYEEQGTGFDCWYEIANKQAQSTAWSEDSDTYTYTANGVIADDTAGRLTVTSGNNIVSVFNNREFTNSGIRVDILPYAVIVLAAAAACVVLVVSKKKRNAR
jgi:hypothetical protein